MREMKDPRVVGVTLTAVDVSRDLEHAKVWFTTFTEDHEGARQGLARAAGYLRSELAQRMKLRTVPRLSFQYDESIGRGARLSRLIDDAVASNQHAAEQEAAEHGTGSAAGSEADETPH